MTDSTEPSLMLMVNRTIVSISTMDWRTSPLRSWRAAPRVRLDMPDTIAASWSPAVRSRSSDTAMSRPSADTTSVCLTPGTLLTKLSRSQLKLAASVLIVVTVVVLRRRSGVGPAGLIGRAGAGLERGRCRGWSLATAAGGAGRGAAALDAGLEAAEHAADV